MEKNINRQLPIKYRYLKRRKLLTCVIGAKCAEGTVIVSDKRVMREFEANNESKIHKLWDRVVLAGAGSTALLDKFAEAISKSTIPTAPNFQRVVEIIEDVIYGIQTRYRPRIGEDYDLQSLIMGLQEFDRGEPYLRLIHETGISEDVKDYAIIGHGAPYVAPFFRLLYDPMLTVNETAVLGYFAISTIVYMGLDQTVGINELGPETIVLRADEEPVFLNPLDPQFMTARQSLKSLVFRYKLVKAVWNHLPQAYENFQQSLF